MNNTVPEYLPHDFTEPPPMLAQRTCANIWATLDMEERSYMNEHNHTEEQGYTPNSGTFLDSSFFSPESVLPASFLLGSAEPEEREPEKPKTVKKSIEINAPPQKHSTPWVGLIASVSVGIVVAFFLFPMIELVKRSTRSYVTGSWESEINRRVGQYEQIHANQGNTPQIDEVLPYNLASSSWQELRVEGFSNLLPSQQFGIGILDIGDAFAAAIEPPVGNQHELYPPHPNAVDTSELDVHSMADSMLLVTPGQNNSVRSAFGQNILLKEGRIFFRVLPGMESAQ